MKEVMNVDGKKVLVRNDVFTWSNLISLSRVLVTIPIIYLHYENNREISLIVTLLIFYGAISDYLDGLVARLRNEISELGKILDPVADKVMAFFLFFYTVWLGWIPLWFFAIGVVRDVLIMIGSGYIKSKRGKVAMSTMSGKISVNVLALYWIAVFFFREATTIHSILMIVSLIMMAISFVHYFYRYKLILDGADFN
ncbi:CDP-alcohol phosphatidyltransferase family protein [Rhodohalobacter sp. SW132]|uniref:CDP-alcohol phosphatidyltransferase family protein n=1 Tax=Rhodohalobacter sp. SW132 TaxID=2293433 RepID=UPI000E247562|nr:CDP-alcohol phosphatidyltransferase family protein [Rhodohalobacter sp. SW132]REL39065.1 CDP-alcohol phosphatidyltransferase family protein [Rhodohalobacter sp. SW132]